MNKITVTYTESEYPMPGRNQLETILKGLYVEDIKIEGGIEL